MKYQFNKISLQRLEKELNIRLKALPTLKAKESALRQEVKKAQENLKEIQNKLNTLHQKIKKSLMLWAEYPDLLSIQNIVLQERNIAGVKIFHLVRVDFQVVKAGLFHQRAWVVEGTDFLKKRVELIVAQRLWEKNLHTLHEARRKTTQKVNLYEKVQIPEYRLAMRRIKGFLEDEENLSRSAQKIVKARKSS